jgi:hypothetical protein
MSRKPFATAIVTAIKPPKIERGVPIPSPHWGQGAGPAQLAIRHLFDAGGPGDSIFIPKAHVSHRANLNLWSRRVSDKGSYAIRTVDGGYRVWKLV